MRFLLRQLFGELCESVAIAISEGTMLTGTRTAVSGVLAGGAVLALGSDYRPAWFHRNSEGRPVLIALERRTGKLVKSPPIEGFVLETGRRLAIGTCRLVGEAGPWLGEVPRPGRRWREQRAGGVDARA